MSEVIKGADAQFKIDAATTAIADMFNEGYKPSKDEISANTQVGDQERGEIPTQPFPRRSGHEFVEMYRSR